MNILDLPITPAIIEYYYMYSTDYLAETIDEFDDYLSPELKAIEDWDDRTDALCKFLDEHITNLSTITEYYSLEDSYSEEVLILKVDDEIIGIPFTYSSYGGIEVKKNKLGSFPRYHETTEITYKRN